MSTAAPPGPRGRCCPATGSTGGTGRGGSTSTGAETRHGTVAESAGHGRGRGGEAEFVPMVWGHEVRHTRPAHATVFRWQLLCSASLGVAHDAAAHLLQHTASLLHPSCLIKPLRGAFRGAACANPRAPCRVSCEVEGRGGAGGRGGDAEPRIAATAVCRVMRDACTTTGTGPEAHRRDPRGCHHAARLQRAQHHHAEQHG